MAILVGNRMLREGGKMMVAEKDLIESGKLLNIIAVVVVIVIQCATLFVVVVVRRQRRREAGG